VHICAIAHNDVLICIYIVYTNDICWHGMGECHFQGMMIWQKPFIKYRGVLRIFHPVPATNTWPRNFRANIYNKNIIIKYIKLIRTIRIILTMLYNVIYIYTIVYLSLYPSQTYFPITQIVQSDISLHRWASRPCATAQQNKWLDLAEMDAMTQKTDI